MLLTAAAWLPSEKDMHAACQGCLYISLQRLRQGHEPSCW